MLTDRSNDTETWKAVKVFWDGSSKNNGTSGCGVVIIGADRDKWVTVSKVAVFVSVGTAMAVEVMGVCVLTETLDLVFANSLSVQNINRCIGALLGNQ